MGRREDINRHHTIRHTHIPPPRRKISTMLLVMLIVTVAMGVSTLGSHSSPVDNALSAASPKEPAVSRPPKELPALPQSTRAQLFDAAAVMAEGHCGVELLDRCMVMANSFAAEGDADAAAYATLLVNGAEPDDEASRLITAIANDDAQAEIYRLALAVSYQNRLRIETVS